MKKIFLYIVAILFSLNGFTQNQNNIWNFGFNCNINFNTNPPSSNAGNQMVTNEGSAAIADEVTGALLFYTDGITVWTSNNAVMPNGSGLLGGNTAATNPNNPFSSTSAAVIVPRPFTPNIYYIFTIDQEDSTNGLRYSVVDMTLNGGLGDAVSGQKNIPLFSTTSEKLHAVPNASGCGYWLLTHDNPGNTFIAFSITQSGINTTPVLSAVGSIQTNGRAHMKVNQQLNKLAMGNSAFLNRIIELFDFNNATGTVSNPIAWNYPFPFSGTDFAGVEFSPDETKLYISNFIRILQYDISLGTAALIGASGVEISAAFPALTLPGTMQLAPDQKIYITSNPLSVINNPNNSGASSGLQLNPIPNFVGTTRFGLPQKIYSLTPNNPNNTILFSGTCEGQPTQFSLQDISNIVSIAWNFGDPSTGANNTSALLSPAHTFSNDGSFTVTATIQYPCNSIIVTQNVTISNSTIPTFTPIPAFSAGTTAPILPTTSLNGITGTWSPATISNTANGTYTFTPSTGQCVTTTTINTTVTTCPNSNEIVVSGNCTNQITSFSLLDNNNIVSVSWNFGEPSAGVNNFATGLNALYIYTNPATYTVTADVVTSTTAYTLTQTVVIQPSIALQFSFPVFYLTGAAVPALPLVSDNGITGTWSPSVIDNTTSGSYTFTPTASGCYIDNIVFIFIEDFITPTFSPITVVCAGVTPPTLPTTSLNGITGTWSPSTIDNNTSGSYTFTPNPGQSAEQVTIFITVTNDLPSVTLTSATSTLNQSICSNEFITPIVFQLGGPANNASITNLPNGLFGSISGTTLTLSGIALEASLTPFTFIITTSGGNCGTATASGTITVSDGIVPTFTPIPSFCAGATIPILPTTSLNGITGTWSPAIISNSTNGTYTFTPNAGQCANTATLNTIVIPSITPIFNPIPTFCAGANAPILPTNSLNGITGTWSPAIISNSTNGTYTFTPNAGQCANTATLDITVIPSVTPTFNPIPTFCAGTTAPILPTTSLNGITGTWSPALINNTTTATYTFTPNNGQCATTTTLNITVTQSTAPTFGPIPAFCAGTAIPLLPSTSLNGVIGSWSPSAINNTATGTYTFTPNSGQCATASTLNINVTPTSTTIFNPIPAFCAGTTAPTLPSTSLNGITGTWSPALINNTASATYTFTPNTGQCATTTTLNVIVTPTTTPTFSPIPAFCAGTSAPVLPSTSLNGITGTWSPLLIDNTATATYTFTPNQAGCFSTLSVGVVVNANVSPNFQDSVVCENNTNFVLPPISPNGIIGTWSPATVNLTTSGSYTFTPAAGQCATSQTIEISIETATLPTFTIQVNEPFADSSTITVIPALPGNYLYQLDFGPIQNSTVFNNVTSGIHTITIYDENGCAAPVTINDILVIKYPKYFTPNNDGYNDTWNIKDLFFDSNAFIYIFDRYGKLLKQIFPNSEGWDGRYNNNDMPSTDYWFSVTYQIQGTKREFKSHFALKR